MNIGRVFKQERERIGITQREMAKRLGLTTSALWKIEANRNWPKPSTIEMFCRVVCIPLAYFYIHAVSPEDFFYPEA